MNKFKFVGILNIVIGIVQFFQIIIFYVFLKPRLPIIYMDFGKWDQMPTSGIFLLPILIFGIANMIFGVKLLSGDQKQLKKGIILIIIAVIFSGFFFGYAGESYVVPNFNTTSPL